MAEDPARDHRRGCRTQLVAVVLVVLVIAVLLGGAFCGLNPSDPTDPDTPILTVFGVG
jgi:hypothetical protein